MSFRIGTDIGGTFTDLTLSRDGVLCGRFKSPTTPRKLSLGVLDCVALAAESLGLSTQTLLGATGIFVHGSTVATNAVLEGKVAKTGVLCTAGTKYTLWRGEGRRKAIFDFTAPPRTPLVRPSLCLELDERITRDGTVLRPLRDAEVEAALAELRALGCSAVAVCLLWSVRNPAHERRIAEIAARAWPEATLSLSSEVQPVVREYTRMSCTTLNAMLKPGVARYLQDLEGELRAHGLRGEVLVVASDGGVQPIAEVAERPVYMLFSGPATGPSAARHFAAKEGHESCLLIDMGGTSFDVSTVIDGQIGMTVDGRIDNHPTGVSAVQILTLGAGGGSIARVDEGGLLRVGPDSAGAEPGPVCYGRGGSEPTVTDAYLALGWLMPERFLGGRMQLGREAARRAIAERIAAPLGITTEEAALGICRVVNERMVNGILEMTVRKGIDPRQLVLVTGGGATGIAAMELARELGMPKAIVPAETSVLCAFGAMNADLSWSCVSSYPTSTRAFAFDAVNAELAGLLARGAAFLDRLAVPAEERRQEVFAAARYPMQVTELVVACPQPPFDAADVAALGTEFHRQYRARYAVSEPGSEVELVMWYATARGLTAAARPAPDTSATRALTSARLGTTPLYDAAAAAYREALLLDPAYLPYDTAVPGPALIVAPDTTVVVPGDASVTARRGGYLVIEFNG
ncbi:MAG: hydantoinase/oxoprolinase family protein [Gammaproteobacteria bacterium]|nr:hydantoinase/oxoprolinase family protein [Gammaproteobacteria bacterium]